MFCSSPGFACVVGLMWCCMSVLCVSCAFLFFALDGRGDGTRVCFGWSMVMGLVCALDGLCFWLRVLAVLEFKLFCVNTFARRSELLVASVVSVLKLSCGLAMCLEMVQSSELLMGLLDLADISQIVIFVCSVLTDCVREAQRLGEGRGRHVYKLWQCIWFGIQNHNFCLVVIGF